MSNFIPGFRLKSILLYLANSASLVTINQIADEIGVSRRTVLRDMQDVEKWLKENGFSLYKKSGKGVMLEGGEEAAKRLVSILNEKIPEVVNIPKDRQKMLLVELLQSKEPVKLYYYTSKFGVSVSTLSNDLDKVEEWLNKYNLTLVRKAGLGVYVSGTEKDFRRAMISLLHENLSEEDLVRLVKNAVTGMETNENITQITVRNRLLNLIDRNSIGKLENILFKLEKTLPYRLVESARIGLMVHLALAIKRIKNNEKISIDPALLEQLKKLNEYLFAKDIAQEVAEQFNIEIPEDEIGYITMHLNGARVYNSTMRDENLNEKKDLFDIANEMIKVAEKEFGVNLTENEKLLYDLVCHLDPALRRLQMDLDIRNPLLDKLKQLFPEAYKISERAAQVLKNRMATEIPESEIGYLAMHFGAAVEKNRTEAKSKYRIIVACPSGIGSSRLLSARLEKEFKDLEIIDILATSDISREYLIENNVDYVISTIPIENCAVKNICVNPLLMEEDKKHIKQIIYGADRILTRHEAGSSGTKGLKDNIRNAANYSSFILDILNNNYLLVNSEISNEKDFASQFPTSEYSDPLVQAAVKESLTNKENLILHDHCVVAICSLKKITESGIVICRAGEGLINKLGGRALNYLIILLVPERLKNSHAGIIKDFGDYISNNLIIKLSDSESTNELSERFHNLIKELYAAKLDEWRNNII